MTTLDQARNIKIQQALVMAMPPLEISVSMAKLTGKYRVSIHRDDDYVVVFPAQSSHVAGTQYGPQEQADDAREWLLDFASKLEPPGAIAVQQINESISAMLMQPRCDGSWRIEHHTINWMEAYFAEADALARLAMLMNAIGANDETSE